MRIDAGTIKRIHVSQVNLRANRKDGGKRTVFTIQTSKGPIYAQSVDIKGTARFVYRPDRPLSCGARIWCETRAVVVYEPKR